MFETAKSKKTNSSTATRRRESNSPFFKPIIQRKATVNQPNDVHEQEADAMANKVMRMRDNDSSRSTFFKPATPSIQRKCAHCEEQAQRKEGGGTESTASHSLGSYVTGLNSGGEPLTNELRSFYEPRFGHDFSDVRVHTDAEAQHSAQSVNALAYTSGTNIVFNKGQFSPNSDSGKHLLAHELTHVIQQTNGAGVMKKNIQRAKIPHGSLTWADFQGPLPKAAAFDAATYSDINEPDWDAATPKTFTAVDTGGTCKAGKKDESIFSVDITIDADKIKADAFMWQEKSWKKPWTTEAGARETKCKDSQVKKCKKSFTELFKSVEADCKDEKEPKPGKDAKSGNVNMKFCKELFPSKNKVQVGDEEVEVTIDNCSKTLLSKCISQGKDQAKKNTDNAKDLKAENARVTEDCNKKENKEQNGQVCNEIFPDTRKATFGGDEIEVPRKDCKKTLSALCVKSGKEGVTVDFDDVPTLTKPEECETVLLEACKTTLMDHSSDKLLEHEQAHFDLTNAVSDNANSALSSLLAGLPASVEGCKQSTAEAKAKTTVQDNIKKLKAAYNKIKAQLSPLQGTYDAEAAHGANEKEQTLWEENIRAGLPKKSVKEKKSK